MDEDTGYQDLEIGSASRWLRGETRPREVSRLPCISNSYLSQVERRASRPRLAEAAGTLHWVGVPDPLKRVGYLDNRGMERIPGPTGRWRWNRPTWMCWPITDFGWAADPGDPSDLRRGAAISCSVNTPRLKVSHHRGSTPWLYRQWRLTSVTKPGHLSTAERNCLLRQ